VSDIETSDRSFGRRTISDRLSTDPRDVLPDSLTGRPEREGLPSGFRMRADAHYVEQLANRREQADRPDTSRHQSGQADMTPSDNKVERDRRSDRVMNQVSEELATIAAATTLAADPSPLARRLGLDLVRAQVWRASWLLKASAIVDGRYRGSAQPTPIGTVAEQLRQGLAPECRLSGVTLQVQVTDPNAVISVDAALVIAGMTGAVVATLGLMGEAGGATIRVVLEVAGSELRTIEVTQDLVAVPASAGTRFFDAAWTDRPGGWTAAIGALSARSTAHLLGGGAAFVPGERRGSTVRMTTRGH
jgi:hypothetical protein